MKRSFPKVATARSIIEVENRVYGDSIRRHLLAALERTFLALPDTATVAEVVMNPLMTPLLLRAQARGLRIVKGDAMLKCQLAAWVAFLGFDTARAQKETSA